MSELKPCPFCGKPADDRYNRLAKCSNEQCLMNYWIGDDGDFYIREDWNTRPIEDDLRKRIAELREDNATLGDSNAWIKQNYEDLERDYGVMYDKMCARIDKVTAENKVLEDACEILRKQNKRLFSQVISNTYGKEREE